VINAITKSVWRIAFFLLMAIMLNACSNKNPSTPILLFNGTGASANDVVAIETILNSSHLSYSTINSSELNGMGEAQMRRYRLLIVPGGNFIDMGNSLTPGTLTRIRDAVHHGLNYLGICAGGFLAGNSGGHYNSLNLTSGIGFGFYVAENDGIHKAAVAIASPGSPPLDQYWEDGPQFTGWGTVIAKYPDNTPAIVQGKFGNGCVVLTGVHAEAPDNWRGGMIFHTQTNTDNAYAATLVRASLNRTELPHY